MASLSAAANAVVLCFVFLFAPLQAQAYLKPEADELMALPKFCWGRYKPELRSPNYHIPRKTCGPATNHYCDALINYLRSTRPGRTRYPGRLINSSIKEIRYTIKAIKDRPACPIRKHVFNAYRQALQAQQIIDMRNQMNPRRRRSE